MISKILGFSFRFGTIRAFPLDKIKKMETGKRKSSPMKTKGNRIMIIEDDLPLLYSLSFTLKRHQYLVDTASNGRDALGRLLEAQRQGMPFDLLVTDALLPGIAELDIIDRLHEHGVRIPVLVITAGADKNLRAHLEQRNIKDILAKPFNADELVKHVKSILERQPHFQ
jgi:DNA-binding response OmpR family regulator